MSNEGASSTQSIRIAVLCERLRTRETNATQPVEQHPATEEQVQEAERRLGFRLPAMLRALYLDVDNGYMADIDGYFDIVPVDDLGAYHTGWRLPTAVVAALQRYPGSYVTWGEDGLPDSAPDGFVHLVMGGAGFIGVMLDLHTGHIYHIDPDMADIAVSFGAPSVEDWLEREIDASPSIRWRGHPTEKLATILEAEGTHLAELVRIPTDAKPYEEQTWMEASHTIRVGKQETARLREENLGTEGPDTSQRYRDSAPLRPGRLRVNAAGRAIERARHELLRQLYIIIDVLEDERRWADELPEIREAESRPHVIEQLRAMKAQQAVMEQKALEELRSLIVADIELASLTEKIACGTSRSDLMRAATHPN